ncbi:hypothetical protein H5T53_05055 [Candidatus Bipolaricaulota bacterium]|nr:hypothetical protein [Candidatus Bipolaricaulota bacterium]
MRKLSLIAIGWISFFLMGLGGGSPDRPIVLAVPSHAPRDLFFCLAEMWSKFNPENPVAVVVYGRGDPFPESDLVVVRALDFYALTRPPAWALPRNQIPGLESALAARGLEPLLAMLTKMGDHAFVPMAAEPLLPIYNMATVRGSGLEASPRTCEEFMAIVKGAQAAGQWALLVPGETDPVLGWHLFEALYLVGARGEPVIREAHPRAKGGPVSVGTLFPEEKVAVQVAAFLNDLLCRGLAHRPKTVVEGTPQDFLSRGETASIFGRPLDILRLGQQDSGWVFQAGLPPVPEDRAPAMFTVGFLVGFYVTSTKENLERASAVAAWLLSHDADSIVMERVPHLLPMRDGLATVSDLATQLQHRPELIPFAEVAAFTVPSVHFALGPEVYHRFWYPLVRCEGSAEDLVRALRGPLSGH